MLLAGNRDHLISRAGRDELIDGMGQQFSSC
jgi:hypothetical protein